MRYLNGRLLSSMAVLALAVSVSAPALASTAGFDTPANVGDVPFKINGQQIVDLTAAGMNLTGALNITTANGEGGTIQLKGANGQNVWVENQNGLFRTINSPWNLATFTVDQSGNATVAANLQVGNGVKVNAGGLITSGYVQAFPGTYFGGNPQIFANGDNHAGGGIAISDDGGFYDYNDGYVTFNGANALRVAGTSGPGSAGRLIVNGVAEVQSFNGEGGVVQLDGNNGVRVYLESQNGVFRLVNNPWNFQMFSVDQGGNTVVAGDLTVQNNAFQVQMNGSIGYFGFGPTSANQYGPGCGPTCDIQYDGGSDGQFFMAHNGSWNGGVHFGWQGDGSWHPLFDILNNGYVQVMGNDMIIGGNGGGGRLHLNGSTVYDTGNYLHLGAGLVYSDGQFFTPGGGVYSWSDERLKQNIAAIGGAEALDKMAALRPVLYDWRNPALHDNKTSSGGFIAQDLQKIFPDMVTETTCVGEDCKLVKDGKQLAISLTPEFSAYLVAAIKENQAEIKAQAAVIDALEKRVQQLEAARK